VDAKKARRLLAREERQLHDPPSDGYAFTLRTGKVLADMLVIGGLSRRGIIAFFAPRMEGCKVPRTKEGL
jgi:hypothetical protein